MFLSLVSKVVGYDSRPILKITPPSNAKDSRLQVYRYVEAVKALPTTFTSSETEFIFKKINPKLCGQLRSLFICISDDEFRRSRLRSKPESPEEGAESETDQAAETESSPTDESVATSNSTKGSKSGSSKTASNRGPKRGASSPPENAGPLKK